MNKEKLVWATAATVAFVSLITGITLWVNSCNNVRVEAYKNGYSEVNDYANTTHWEKK